MNDATFAALIGGAAGALVSGVFTLLGYWLRERNETKRALIAQCFKTGLENWNREVELAKGRSAKYGITVPVPPLDLYILQMYLTAGLMAKSGGDHGKLLTDWQAMTKAGHQAYDELKSRQEAEAAARGETHG